MFLCFLIFNFFCLNCTENQPRLRFSSNINGKILVSKYSSCYFQDEFIEISRGDREFELSAECFQYASGSVQHLTSTTSWRNIHVGTYLYFFYELYFFPFYVD